MTSDPLRVWTPAELLAAIPPERQPVGGESEYANVNFLLLTLIIEEVTGRPMVQVLRDGVLNIDGVERLIYQPDEAPTEPIAIEHGRSYDYLEAHGGFVPSLALTSDRGAAAMASDSVSLGNWWRAFCAGEIVSQASLDEMLPKDDWYGLGLGEFGLGIVGHFGSDAGYVTLAGCMPESRIVFAILFNDGSMSLAEGNALLGAVQRAIQNSTSRTHYLADGSRGGLAITITLPSLSWTGERDQWHVEGPGGFQPPAGVGIISFTVDEEFYVYGDPCHWSSTRPAIPATTVEEIAAALASQSSRIASPPEDITTRDGYSGKKLTLYVPNDVVLSECDEGAFSTLSAAGEDMGLFAQGAGEIDEFWIVDVDGRIALLEGGYYADTPQDSIDQLHAILGSATFGPVE
jgi:hypothetical protein